jgi:probable addiction module antidote protein
MIKRKIAVQEFDASTYLDSEEMIAGYLAEAAEDPDPRVFLIALGDVAKARGMTEIARRTGLGRQGLYKALAPGSNPHYTTVRKIMTALGVAFTAQPMSRDDLTHAL